MEMFALNHSEQLYFLNPLGIGRVRKVRHKFNSEVRTNLNNMLTF
jgi:hypothetical protein